MFWIEKYKKNNLTNHDKGGSGGAPIFYKRKYNEVKNWVQKNLKNIKSASQWFQSIKEINVPYFIPKNPQSTYKNRGWISWEGFLSTKRSAPKNKNFLNYQDFISWCKKENVNTKEKWSEIRRNRKMRPDFIPYCPDQIYKKVGNGYHLLNCMKI